MGEGEGRRKQLQLPPQHSHHLEAPSTGLFWSLLPGRITGGPESFCNPTKRSSGLSASKWPAGLGLSQGQAELRKDNRTILILIPKTLLTLAVQGPVGT